ncbi:hypothetical protein PPYR_10218 [Photinus pyralis]|uniref:Adenosine 3'-phospho 5'-phosphosulfate transporter 2 n=1 Tax=Photinus pyralis TaxID=7054 RepID=A0A5N4AFQ4_PHOPY|nr:adenosine 3'-phospho 5'-phosphosulfate transporter 2 [Photinus pyralis]KAB0796157.1 hypothetical protein PPYR_10218 [Photinus pyralis]
MSKSEERGLLDPGEKTKVQIICFNISKYHESTQFFISCVAVFIFFILYGYMQELIFTLDGFKPFGWYLTLIQFGYYTLFGMLEKAVKQEGTRRMPMPVYFFLALLTLGTIGLSNSSLQYLNYPTQVIFKCCKLIPVLIGSILIQGKRYGPLDFGAAILMCVGLTLFTLADSKVSPNFNTKGVIIISLALLCDAIIGNVQEKNMKLYNASTTEVVLYSYSIGFIYIFTIMLLTGDLLAGIQFCAQFPMKTYGYALIFSLTGYLGIQIVLTLVQTCGAFVAVTVTTCRKAVTIIISFMLFAKPFTFQYIWSGLLVVLGIYLNLYSKRHPFSFTDLENKVEKWVLYFRQKPYTRIKGRMMTDV